MTPLLVTLRSKWKELALVGLTIFTVTTVARPYALRYFGIVDGTTLVALGGVVVVPSKYWLDTLGGGAGTMFSDFSSDSGGRIVAGRLVELKDETWKWVREATQSEETRCGVRILKLLQKDIRSTFAYDDRTYLWFLSVPEDEIETSLQNLCQWKANTKSLSNPALQGTLRDKAAQRP
ncbi:MAG: hypothetical protein K9J74_14245 [Sulfuritalea sp.]|nr:hypothetical protein [Sulfuritalea sp.]